MASKSLACCCLCLVLPNALFADTLKGLVQDEQGKPIVGARVDIATAAPKVGRGNFCPSCYLDCKKWARTDENGRFEIPSVDPKLKFRVLTTAPGKHTHITDYIDPSAESVELTLVDLPTEIPLQRLIQGVVVRDGDVPVPGALLEPFGYKTPQVSSFGPVEARPAVADDNGRFQMLLNKDYEEVFVQVTADELAGTTLLLKPAQETRIVVPVGTSVAGRLVAGGQPQRGAAIAVVQTNRRSGTHFIKAVLAVTDREGRFEFQNLPASQQYAIFSPVGDLGVDTGLTVSPWVLQTKTFQVRGDGETRDLGVLEMTHGLTFAGRIELPEGQPRPPELKLSLGRDPAWDLVELPVGDDGQFAMANLPLESYQVRVIAPGLRPDLTRMNFQGLRMNSFGVRLTRSLEDVRIPLVPDKLDAPEIAAERAEPDVEPTTIAPTISKGQDTKSARPKQLLRDEPIPEDGPKLNVHGTVVTFQGERIADAEVTLLGDVNGTSTAISPLQYGDVLARTATDANGRFIFSNVPIPLRLQDAISKLTAGAAGAGQLRLGARVLAVQKDRGMGWAEVEALDAPRPLRIVLGPGATVVGRIVDPSGCGIPNARVQVETIGPVAASLRLHHQSADQLFLQMSDAMPTAITDAQGNFTLPNLPAGRHILAQVEGPGFEWKRVAFNTTPGNAAPAFADISFSQLSAPVMKSPAKITLAPVAHVRIRVQDENGRPVTDGEVSTLETNRRSGARRIGLDRDGQAIVPVKHTGTYTVSYTCEPLQPRVGASLTKELSNERPNEPITIRLPATRWLTGRVVSADTGQPVVGAWVRFKQTAGGEPSASATCISITDGEFRLPVVPGPIRLTLVQRLHGFHAPWLAPPNLNLPGTDIVIPPQDNIPAVTLKFTPGLVIEGTVVDPEGEPVPNQLVRAEAMETGLTFNPMATRTNSKGQFRLAGMPPSAAVIVTAVADGTAADVVIEPAPNLGDTDLRQERVQLTLRAGVQLSGRVLNRGQPLAGAVVEIKRSRPATGDRSRVFAVVATNSEGRYLVGGLEPGDGYQVQISTSDGWLVAGGPHLSPMSQTIPANHAGVLELPDVNLVRAQQTLAGIVVDPEGEPVFGVQIYARLTSGRNIPHRQSAPPTSMMTGPSGHFRLEQLPDEPIQLTAYLRGARPVAAAGMPIRFPVELQPLLNQTDIRMVLDPRLSEPVDDLDQP